MGLLLVLPGKALHRRAFFHFIKAVTSSFSKSFVPVTSRKVVYLCFMKGGKRSRPLFLFHAVVIYVIIQFGWWTYLLVRLNNEVNVLQQRVLLLEAMPEPASKSTTDLAVAEKNLRDKLHKQWGMIFGEGSVFLVLLLLGILRTRNSFKKEVALSTQQKNFLLSVTHELKSPLASVRLQLETIQKRPLSKEKQDEVLSNAIEDTDRLNALVENILFATRIDNHTYVLHREKGNISDEIKGLSEKASVGFARHHKLITDIANDVTTSFDKMGFHSIFVNLLENAVKYSPAGTEIKVTLKKNNEALYLSIADHGPGISDKEKGNVFGRFYRIGNEETRSTKGTGLGLYIVHSLVEAQEWSIRILDNKDGGSIFEIIIPNS
jgi:two-component system phosphate regulon sensor histidine kinase PhoR